MLHLHQSGAVEMKSSHPPAPKAAETAGPPPKKRAYTNTLMAPAPRRPKITPAATAPAFDGFAAVGAGRRVGDADWVGVLE